MLNPHNKTVGMIFLTLCAFLSLSCRTLNYPFKSFTGETIAFRWENLRASETDFITKDDSISIFRNKTHTVYRLPSYHTLTTTSVNKNGDVIDENTTTTLEFHYFVHKNSETYGSMYDSINATSYRKRMLIDSFLIKHAFKNSHFDNLDNWRKISTIKENDHLTEIYIPNYKSETDTVYFSFSKKLRDLKYSFSFKLDNFRNSKLFQIKFVHNAIPPQPDDIYIPRKVYFFELKRANVIDNESIRGLIKVNDFIVKNLHPGNKR